MIDEREGLPSTSDFDVTLRCLKQRTRVKELGLVKEDNEFSDSGTKIHEYKEGKDVKLSEEELEISESISRNELKLKEKLGFVECEEVKEERLWRNHVFNGKIWSSKLDLQCIKKDEGLVIDYKTGFLELVDASTSLQLLGEMVVFYEKTRLPVIHGALVRRFHYDYITLTDKDLEREGNRLDNLVAQSLDPSSPYSPGYIQCVYCPVRKAGMCPAQSNTIATTTGLDVTESKINSLSNYQRRELFDNIKIAKKKLDELEEVLEDYAHKGMVEGCSYKDASRRTLTADCAEISELFPEVGDKKLLELSSITMDALDKLKISKRLEEMGLIKKIQYQKLVRK